MKKQKKSQVEKVVSGNPWDEWIAASLKWDEWIAAMYAIAITVAVAAKDKRIKVPVEVNVSSAMYEPLVSFRLEKRPSRSSARNPGSWGRVLDADESKWQDPHIFPLTITVSDANGDVYEMRVDTRFKKLN